MAKLYVDDVFIFCPVGCRMISTGREGQSEESSLFRTKLSHLNEEALGFVVSKTVGKGLRISRLKIRFSRHKN